MMITIITGAYEAGAIVINFIIQTKKSSPGQSASKSDENETRFLSSLAAC